MICATNFTMRSDCCNKRLKEKIAKEVRFNFDELKKYISPYGWDVNYFEFDPRKIVHLCPYCKDRDDMRFVS